LTTRGDVRDLSILSAAGLHVLDELAFDLDKRGITTTTVAVQPGSLARRLLYLAGLDQRLVVLDASLPVCSDRGGAPVTSGTNATFTRRSARPAR
jgi:hypothetical protein